MRRSAFSSIERTPRSNFENPLWSMFALSDTRSWDKCRSVRRRLTRSPIRSTPLVGPDLPFVIPGLAALWVGDGNCVAGIPESP
jgi:hypothetical protein